jgi:hypothetical protein
MAKLYLLQLHQFLDITKYLTDLAVLYGSTKLAYLVKKCINSITESILEEPRPAFIIFSWR